MARPQKRVDPVMVRKLAAIHCTIAEIAAICGCSSDTLHRRYQKIIESGKSEACSSLRRKQFELAMKGNPTMLVWLGKQWLGQKDKNALEHSGPNGDPIATTSKTPPTDEELEAKIAALIAKGKA